MPSSGWSEEEASETASELDHLRCDRGSEMAGNKAGDLDLSGDFCCCLNWSMFGLAPDWRCGRLSHTTSVKLATVGAFLSAVIFFAVLGLASRVFLFIAIGLIGAAAFGAWYCYVYVRLVADPFQPKTPLQKLIGHASMVIFFLEVVIAFIVFRTSYANPEAPASVLALWYIGTGWVLLLFSLVYSEFVYYPWRLAAYAYPDRVPEPGKYHFAKVRAAACSLLTLILLIVAITNENSDPHVYIVEVPLAGLPAELDGYKMAMGCDIHVGPTIGKKTVDNMVDVLLSMEADSIVLVGDLSDGLAAKLAPSLQSLSRLRAPDGVYFVSGNHDYSYDKISNWVDFLAENGVRALMNERTILPLNASLDQPSFDLAGATDYAMGDPDLPGALKGRDASRGLVVLAHQPKHIKQAYEGGAGLMLAGHVHGGQVWPIHIFSWLGNPYFKGLSLHKDRTYIYVSEGTAQWGPPVRLGSRREHTLIILRTPEALPEGGTVRRA